MRDLARTQVRQLRGDNSKGDEHGQLGRCYRGQEKCTPALFDSAKRRRACSCCFRLWPSYASAHNNLGTLAPSADEAERYFLSAIHFQPAHVNAHYNLGHVYK